MKMNLKKITYIAVSTALLNGFIAPVQASNWLMLQGTEPAGTAPRAKLWGFIQPEYQHTDGTKLPTGTPWAGNLNNLNAIPPDRKSSDQFNIRRARVGVRGTGMPLDSNVNYFFLAEFGNNGITKPGNGGGSAKVTDASVTLNHIKGMRVRVGMFKTPTAEEGLQAIHVFDYINFTNVTDQALLERFVKYDGSGTTNKDPAHAGTWTQSANGVNTPVQGVGAFRDVGIQLFDTFKFGAWEHSYAVMIGNGNGLYSGDNNDSKDTYMYWSSEQVYGGKGPRREGWKLFAWRHEGTRTITAEQGTVDKGDDVEQDVDRIRSGIGTTFRRGKHRAAFEYITAKGLIRNGTDGGAAPGTANATGVKAGLNYLLDDEADGYYLDYGYKPTPKLELDVRYDIYNRATKVAANERRFETWTLGLQYFFNKKSRFVVNYEMRDAEAPNLPASAAPNKILDTVDDRISAEVLVIF